MYIFSTIGPDLKKIFKKYNFKAIYKDISVTFLYNDINQFQIIVPNKITFDNVLDD